MADEESPTHSDEFLAIKFIKHLNSSFSDYIISFTTKVRPWPRTMADAHDDAANYLMARSTAGGNPNGQEKRNVFAASRGGKAGGRGGRGKSGEKGEGRARASTPYRERDESPHREQEGAVQGYGTRYGRCNNCNEEGHYAYECKKPKGSVKKSAAAWNASSEK
jgi:hypothetical protein